MCPVFRAFPASAGSQWPLVQNNPYAKKGIFCCGIFLYPYGEAVSTRTVKMVVCY